MAKKKETVTEQVAEEPKVDDKVEKIKVKKKSTMKELNQDDGVIKVDLTKPKENADTEQETADVASDKQTETVQEVVEEVPQEQITVQDEEQPVVEEITSDVEEVAEAVEEAIVESMETGEKLPENIQKLVDFMEETGGDLNDYVKLNQDYSKLDNQSLLKEFYNQTKPHLDTEEIDFMMEDYFSYDE